MTDLANGRLEPQLLLRFLPGRHVSVKRDSGVQHYGDVGRGCFGAFGFLGGS
jgi:hypothetical protein